MYLWFIETDLVVRDAGAADKPAWSPSWTQSPEWTVECPLPCDAAAEAARAERRRWKQRESRDGGVGPCGASRPRSHDAHERNYRVDRKLTA